MFLFRAMERMGLKGTLAFGAGLLGVNLFFFSRASSDLIAKEEARSNAIKESIPPPRNGSRLLNTSRYNEYMDKLREIRASRQTVTSKEPPIT